MSILEKFKKEADSAVNEYMKRLEENEEGDTDFGDSNPQIKQLVTEMSNAQIVDQQSKQEYEEKQFNFFSSKSKEKGSKCVVCRKEFAKYTCPKCHVKYCSSDHYKSHNMFCSERFFKDQVESHLRATKASKEDKKKIIEMLQANKQECSKDENQLNEQVKVEEITEERLNYLLQKLEREEEIQLTESETKSFQAYLKEAQYQATGMGREEEEINIEQNNEQNHPLKQYVPFWQLQEGLFLYISMNQSIQIEQYSKSQHKDLLNYRQLTAQLLRQDLPRLLEGIHFRKTSIFVNFDLIQVVYLTALLFRSFNGQYLQNSQFALAFMQIYDQDFARRVSEAYPIKMIEAMKESVNIFGLLKANIQNIDNSLKEIVKMWMPITLSDCQKIFSNKYLCLQALFRLLESIRSIGKRDEVKWTDQVMKKQEKQKKVKSKEEKQRERKLIKIMKKIQFLLCFASEIVFKDSGQRSGEEGIEPIRLFNNRQMIISTIVRESNVQKEAEGQLLLLHEQRQNQKKRILNDRILIP